MNGLRERILNLIGERGPISIADYMRMALTDPDAGYYMRRDPLGRDFITAPEVSQMFGEMIGLFFVQAWEDRGRPRRFHLVELGPGRGTLMADLIRAAKIRPAFLDAAHVTLIEASPALRDIQAKTLTGTRVDWRRDVRDIAADAPLFLIANEFFDALPIRQLVRLSGRWHERMIGAADDTLSFVGSPEPVADAAVPAGLRDAPEGTVFETSAESSAAVREITRRIAAQDGIALIIDYGHSESGLGDTFQAVKANRFADPLAEPGEADLTAHVDFAALADAAREAEGCVFGPTPQGSFLSLLGIEARASQLKRAAPDKATEIDAGVRRLIHPDEMGILFKVMAISDGHWRHPDGFACSS